MSGTGRLAALLLVAPAVFLLNRPAEIAASAAFAAACWLLAGRRGRVKPLLDKGFTLCLKSLAWLVPLLVLANGLADSGPRIWGPFSRSGLVLGLLVAYRLCWAAWLAVVLIRTCPGEELLASFRYLLRLARIPDRNLSLTLFLTLELLPQFADISVKDFRNLPEAIATRLQNVVVPQTPPELPRAGGRPRPADLALVVPAAGLLVVSILV